VVPPVTPITWLYGVPTRPLGRLVSVSVNGPPPPVVIVRASGPLVLPCGLELSVTLTVMFDVPAVVGVPATVHPTGVSVNPAGNDPVVIEHV